MKTLTDAEVDELVYMEIVNLGGSFEAARGENLESNVTNAVMGSTPKLTLLQKKELKQRRKEGGITQLPKISNRRRYQAICRLVQAGRVVRVNDIETEELYGSLPNPTRVPVAVAKFKVAS